MIITHALMVMTTLFLLAIMGVFVYSIVRRKKDFRVHLVEQREGRGLDDGIITNVHNRKVCRKTEESEEAVNASVADVVVSQRHELNGAVKT